MGNKVSTKKPESPAQAQYYWRSDQEPFSDEQNAKWETYKEEDNIAFEEAYQKYLTKKGSSQINLQKRHYK